MMVFARYVMFSEVYWHHAVRSATAMLQRAFYLLHRDLDLDRLFRHTEDDMVRELLRASEGGASRELVHGLFGPRRRLYKQLAQYSYFEQRDIYECLARRPYPWLVGCAEEFAVTIARHAGRTVEPWEVIFDAPPAKLEVEFNIEIYFRKEGRYRVLGDVSPVLQTLARQQFDDYVKRVRIFAHPRLADDLRSLASIDEAVLKTVERLD
jgi:HD superfamily phosphohydrolase